MSVTAKSNITLIMFLQMLLFCVIETHRMLEKGKCMLSFKQRKAYNCIKCIMANEIFQIFVEIYDYKFSKELKLESFNFA